MPGWLTSIFTGVAAFFVWRKSVAEKDLRDMDREAGATKQREVDQKETLKAKDDQLEKAVNARPGAARKRMRDGTF